MRGEKLHTLGGLLEKYKKIQAPQGAVNEVFLRAVREILHKEVPVSALNFNTHSRTMHVALAGPLKQELRMHAKKILARCAEDLSTTNTPKVLL